jgi:hypothetical protein
LVPQKALDKAVHSGLGRLMCSLEGDTSVVEGCEHEEKPEETFSTQAKQSKHTSKAGATVMLRGCPEECMMTPAQVSSTMSVRGAN